MSETELLEKEVARLNAWADALVKVIPDGTEVYLDFGDESGKFIIRDCDEKLFPPPPEQEI